MSFQRLCSVELGRILLDFGFIDVVVVMWGDWVGCIQLAEYDGVVVAMLNLQVYVAQFGSMRVGNPSISQMMCVGFEGFSICSGLQLVV